MMKIIKYIIIFGLVMTVLMFGFLFVKSILNENIINPIGEELKKVSTDLSLDPIIGTTIDDTLQYYSDFDLKADLIFFVSWLAFEVSVVLLAVNLPKLPTLNFFSFLTLGMLVVMFFFDFVSQFSVWFIQNFISNVFTVTETYLPIFNFYQTYQPIIIFFNILLVLFINQIINKPTDQTADLFEQSSEPSFNPEIKGGLEE